MKGKRAFERFTVISRQINFFFFCFSCLGFRFNYLFGFVGEAMDQITDENGSWSEENERASG